jgi:hypothetical protein
MNEKIPHGMRDFFCTKSPLKAPLSKGLLVQKKPMRSSGIFSL